MGALLAARARPEHGRDHDLQRARARLGLAARQQLVARDLLADALRAPARRPSQRGRPRGGADAEVGRLHRRGRLPPRLHRQRRRHLLHGAAGHPPLPPKHGLGLGALEARPNALPLRHRRLPDRGRGREQERAHLHPRRLGRGRGRLRNREAGDDGHRRRRARLHDRLLLEGGDADRGDAREGQAHHRPRRSRARADLLRGRQPALDPGGRRPGRRRDADPGSRGLLQLHDAGRRGAGNNAARGTQESRPGHDTVADAVLGHRRPRERDRVRLLDRRRREEVAPHGPDEPLRRRDDLRLRHGRAHDDGNHAARARLDVHLRPRGPGE